MDEPPLEDFYQKKNNRGKGTVINGLILEKYLQAKLAFLLKILKTNHLLILGCC